ncbi:MAG: hypothetical protein GX219_00135 [Tissierellia bacterium]|nr:hypothetical protein [Tissierellia bacterium]
MKNKNLFIKVMSLAFLFCIIFNSGGTVLANDENHGNNYETEVFQKEYAKPYGETFNKFNGFDKREVNELLKELNEKYNDFSIENNEKGISLFNFTTHRNYRRNEYPIRAGQILVTADRYKGVIPTGHAAMVIDRGNVIESNKVGVVYGPNNWYRTKETCFGLSVGGVTEEMEKEAAKYCGLQLGKPYNYIYGNISRRDAFYCSQLVHAAYWDKFGINLDTPRFGYAIHPLELVDSWRTIVVYYK